MVTNLAGLVPQSEVDCKPFITSTTAEPFCASVNQAIGAWWSRFDLLTWLKFRMSGLCFIASVPCSLFCEWGHTYSLSDPGNCGVIPLLDPGQPPRGEILIACLYMSDMPFESSHDYFFFLMVLM